MSIPQGFEDRHFRKSQSSLTNVPCGRSLLALGVLHAAFSVVPPNRSQSRINPRSIASTHVGRKSGCTSKTTDLGFLSRIRYFICFVLLFVPQRFEGRDFGKSEIFFARTS